MFNSKNGRKILAIIAFFIILVVSFLPRFIGLSIPTINPDALTWESGAEFYINNIMLGQFIEASKAASEEKPGLTPYILIGMGYLFLQNNTFQTPFNIFKKHTASAIPITFVSALTAPIAYLILRKITKEKLAFISAIIIALSPYHIAQSRQIHMDTVLTFFTFIPLLLYILSQLRDESILIKALAGFLWGFGILTKLSGWGVLVGILIIKIFTLLYFKERNTFKWRALAGDLLFIASGIAIFYLFYTKLWISPIGGFLKYLKVNLSIASSGHHSFFLGRDYLSPPFYYYPVIVFIRLSIFEIFGTIAGVVFFFLKKNDRKDKMLMFSSSIWIILIIVAMSFAKIKLGARYVMPIWPAISILSAYGIINFSDFISNAILKKITPKKNVKEIISSTIISLFIIAFMLIPIINFYPYYELYYNSLVGGPRSATRIDTVGWGEGMRIAANYIESKTDDDRKILVVGYKEVFNEYCKIDLSKKIAPSKAQYIVIQLNFLQRNLISKETKYALKHFDLEKVVNLKNTDLIWIYRNRNMKI